MDQEFLEQLGNVSESLLRIWQEFCLHHGNEFFGRNEFPSHYGYVSFFVICKKLTEKLSNDIHDEPNFSGQISVTVNINHQGKKN